MAAKGDALAGAPTAAQIAANDQADLTLDQLARGILDRSLRPKVADIRRLAAAVLAAAPSEPRKKDKGSKPRKGGSKKKEAAVERKDRGKKLAKIPKIKTRK